MTETTREALLRRLGALKQERQSWDAHWKELAEWILPRLGRFNGAVPNSGSKVNQNIIDSTAGLALRTLAPGLTAGLTSPARPWFRHGTPDPDLMEFGPVKAWLHQVTRRMQYVFNKGNLYNVLPAAYAELGLFGTAAVHEVEDYADGVRFYLLPCGEYAIANGPRLAVDTCYREFKLTVGQVVRAFGLERCSATLRNQWERGAYDHWVDIVHVVEPNEYHIAGEPGPRGMAYRDVYLELAAADANQLLAVAGNHECPVFSPRWDLKGTDVYGWSPAMDALGDTKQLQHQQKRKAQGLDKAVNPPMVGPSSLRNQPSNTLPGGVTYVDVAQGAQGFRPAYEVRPDLGGLVQDMAETRDRLRSTFFADLFLMLAYSDRGDMTATEVAERHEEKLLALGPVLERLHTELLSPKIDRTFGILLRTGAFPDPPPEVQDVDLKVEYISVLAQAQKLVGVNAVDRFLVSAGNAAALLPETIDKVDLDQALDEYAEMLGVPPGIVRPDEAVTRLRAERARQRALVQAAETGNQAAQAARNLAASDTSSRNLLTDLLGPAAGAVAG